MSVGLNRVSRIVLVTWCGGLGLVAWGCSHQAQPATTSRARPAPATAPVADVATATAVASAERGRYLTLASGCNDCHTPGFQQLGQKVPESIWLTGVPVGWKGPWGTTYGSNLRLFINGMDEQTFVSVTRARNARPPMPWDSLHAMTDDDLRSIYRYLKQLGPAGIAAPADLPPGETPKTPYVDMSVHLPAMPSANAR